MSQNVRDFDLKEFICKDCKASKVKSEHCSSVFSFSGFRSHIKRVHPEVELLKSGYFKEKAGCSCKYNFLFSNLFEASGIDIDDLIEISKKLDPRQAQYAWSAWYAWF